MDQARREAFKPTQGFWVAALLAACALLLLAGPRAAVGQEAPAGYATDGAGNIARTGTGECVRTGVWTEALAIQECDPELVAQVEPPPAPAPEVTPEPQIQRVVLEADTFFGFDQAELLPEGQAELDEIARITQQAQDPTVRITGYTDHIGPVEYNQDLAQRRAEAVKDYLVQQGLPEDRIEVVAAGPAEPLPQCEGLRGDELIECLAPNRRSEVEFAAFVEEAPREEMPQQQDGIRPEDGMQQQPGTIEREDRGTAPQNGPVQ